MRDQEIIGLWEAYQQVHSQPEEKVEQLDEAMSSYDRNRKRAAQRAEARNEARRKGLTGNVPGVGYVSPRPERSTYRDESGVERHHTGGRMPKKEDQKESVDLFDYLLEYLVAEGYADTNKAALAIMANMSEEWKQDIMEISQRTATSAYAQRRTGEFEGDDASDRVAKTNKLKGRIEKKFGAKAGEHADRAADVKTFGRKDASGRRKQSPQPRIQTSDHENQREFKRELRIKRDRRLRAAEDN